MLFLVNIWAEEQQLYKTELLYLFSKNLQSGVKSFSGA